MEMENTTATASHEWELDRSRTRMEINVFVYRCKSCGCLHIKNGGPDAPGVFKFAHPDWNPFKTLAEEPPCGAGVPVEVLV